MTEIKIRPIGERFDDNGVKLEVVECDINAPFFGCLDCHYCGNCWDWKIAGECEAAKRDDAQNVIFKEVKP